MSEYVYILTGQLYYEKALLVAQAVLENNLQDLVATFPDERSICMTEICERFA
jgi:hypothetical protein